MAGRRPCVACAKSFILTALPTGSQIAGASPQRISVDGSRSIRPAAGSNFMRNIFFAAVLIGSFVLTTMFSVAAAYATNTNKDRLIHSFSPAPSGFPESGLTVDAAGNLYGTTYGTFGCANSCGEVFELSPGANGQFQYRVLHTFTRGTGDGIFPQGALVLDAQGHLYGTAGY